MLVLELYGQAVLEEFGGKYAQFILCNSNENNICEEITYERIRRIIEGYQDSKGKNVKGIDANLKYYKLKYIDKYGKENDGYYIENELAKYTKELAQLEHGVDFNDGKIRILFSDDDIDNFVQNDEALQKCEFVYLNNNVLITQNEIDLFEKFGIQICYVPDYYFDEEIMEIGI